MEEVPSQGSVKFITTGVLRDLVYHAGGWEGVQSWSCPLPRAGAPVGRMPEHPTKKQGKKKEFAFDGSCVL